VSGARKRRCISDREESNTKTEDHRTFETYLATVEAAIGQSLDDNTAKELRWAYCAGALRRLRPAQDRRAEVVDRTRDAAKGLSTSASRWSMRCTPRCEMEDVMNLRARSQYALEVALENHPLPEGWCIRDLNDARSVRSPRSG